MNHGTHEELFHLKLVDGERAHAQSKADAFAREGQRRFLEIRARVQNGMSTGKPEVDVLIKEGSLAQVLDLLAYRNR
ncbi:hypothetical protein HYV73_00100 [Candidatus Uhrbacteria bacterium]|nr:hypothetical protein [Candidatus Uhrbacteria bacterium]